MTKIPTDDIMRVVRSAPEGATTAGVAEKLNVSTKFIGGRLSRLATYGKIDREWHKGPEGRHCIWKPREGARA